MIDKILNTEIQNNYKITCFESGAIRKETINSIPLDDLQQDIEPDIIYPDEDIKYIENKLREQDKKVFKLESENADLVLDAAIKDAKISVLERDIADMMIELIMIQGGMK